MDYGAHLPLMDFGGHPYTLDHLAEYTRTVRDHGFSAISVNDHMVFSVPWLDGPAALAAVLEHTGDMDLATTVALPTIRGPVATAKTFGAIDRLSGGRLLLGVGPGSSEKDYDAVGVPFEQRWKRLDESILALRSLWNPGGDSFEGAHYSTTGIDLAPAPGRPGGPPIWVGSWGSGPGLRRTARLADGWLASAYNTTPEGFASAWSQLCDELSARGRNPDGFPNGLATMWFHITDDATEAEAIYQERLFPNVRRPEDQLRDRLPVGPPEKLAAKLAAFGAAGVQRVYLWPVADEVEQIRRFADQVAPLLGAS